MNVTRYLKNRKDPQSRQILFDGEPLTMEAVWRLRDDFFPRRGAPPPPVLPPQGEGGTLERAPEV